MSFELLEYFVTRSRVVGEPVEVFESDGSSKEDGTLLCVDEFRLNSGVARDKGICIS